MAAMYIISRVDVISKCFSFAGAIILFGIFAVYSPHLDQTIALLPYNVVTQHFYGEVSGWCRFVYKLVPWITASIITIAVFSLFYPRRFQQSLQIKKVATITLLALALGPGLVVNVLFKDHWGRARPYQVIRDHKQFTPFWQPQANHPENNSFCGGHASIGFFLGVPLLALGRRKQAFYVGMLGGVVVGAVRMLQGGHYLSDIVLSGICVWLIAELTVYLITKKE